MKDRKLPVCPNIPKCPPVPPPPKNREVIIEKFYNLIKEKVKFNGEYCKTSCGYLDIDWDICKLFYIQSPCVGIRFPVKIERCGQCKLYFGK